jgi:hypothetical protein
MQLTEDNKEQAQDMEELQDQHRDLKRKLFTADCEL